MFGVLYKIFIIYIYYYVTLLYRIRSIRLVSNLKLLLYLLYVLQKQPELDIFSTTFPRSSWPSQEASPISLGEGYRPRDVISYPAGGCLPREGACDQQPASKFSPLYGAIPTPTVGGPEECRRSAVVEVVVVTVVVVVAVVTVVVVVVVEVVVAAAEVQGKALRELLFTLLSTSSGKIH